MTLIAKTHTTDPGIVLLTSPSGAGKSSLLSAGLIPAITSNTLNNNEDWAVARITPNSDPMTELARCLEQPDVKERAEGARLLLIVDQAEQLFTPKVSAESRAEFLDVLHTMCQPSTPAPGAVVVIGLRSDALGGVSNSPNSLARCNPGA
jgi:energy-coupling factor transporter ATP-binding protein EcfA2